MFPQNKMTGEQHMLSPLCFSISDNWAFLYAQKLALKMEVPLYVCFCLVPKFLEATIRHYKFMLEGLMEVEQVSTKCIKNELFKKNMINGSYYE